MRRNRNVKIVATLGRNSWRACDCQPGFLRRSLLCQKLPITSSSEATACGGQIVAWSTEKGKTEQE